MGDLKHEIVIRPACDKKAEGYGIHCAEMVWYVKGDKGAIQFVLYTGWYANTIGTPDLSWDALSASCCQHPHALGYPMPADLGYHSPVPRYEGQSPMSDKCTILDGPCYYDGSSLNAYKPFSILVHEGGDALWAYLDEYYRSTFEEADRG